MILDEFAQWLSGLLMALMTAVFYPLIVGINCLLTVFNQIYAPFALLYNAFVAVYNAFATIIGSVFGLVFPSSWTMIILAAIAIKFGLIFYRYLHDIEILGCKV